jgi:hypothetical protein
MCEINLFTLRKLTEGEVKQIEQLADNAYECLQDFDEEYEEEFPTYAHYFIGADCTDDEDDTEEQSYHPGFDFESAHRLCEIYSKLDFVRRVTITPYQWTNRF